jgi:hypothetical protein
LVASLSAPRLVAQSAGAIWQDVIETEAAAARVGAASRTVVPRFYRTIRADQAQLANALRVAPREFSLESRTTRAELSLPMPDGTYARVLVEESSLMEPSLAARHPNIKTYVVRGIDDLTLSGRLDQTPQGFHAILLTARGTIYIDPYWRGTSTAYLSYRKREFAAPNKSLTCAVQGSEVISLQQRAIVAPRPTGDSLRTYRLAVACTGEYAAAAGGGTVNGTLGAIITTVNRVSAVYERDLAIRMTLIGAEDQLIFLNPLTDGYTNSDGFAMLAENQSKLDTIVGAANYDIGHVFSTGGGGVARLGSVGRAGLKGQGVTGSPDPIGDPFDIDYVAHEMGHQFGANHPFNATSGSCAGGTRNANTAYEPGSGSTIMAYAGICLSQDLAPNSDDYFHTISYDEIDAYTSGASPGNVGVVAATGNTPPTIAVLSIYTIPSQTPFALTASATDPDGDALTYSWEQFDRGAAQDPTSAPRDNGSSPLFRSFDPTLSPTRMFPSLSYILNNANVPPPTVSGLATGEFLPTTNRTMTFRVTVRDNRAGGGGSNYASTTVTSTTAAGPFVLSSFNAASTIAAGSTQLVTWSVAGTTAAPVSCANVKISFSADGGQTFPFVLSASTPNDGSELLTIPNLANVATTQGRFKVEAVGNIFFDISDANTTVTTTNTAPVLTITGGVNIRRGTPTPSTFIVATVSDANTPITASLLNVPAEITLTASVLGSNVNVSAVAGSSVTTTNTSRTYPITLVVTDSLGATSSGTFNLLVGPNLAPSVGEYANQSVLVGASATVSPFLFPSDGNGNLGPTPLTVTPATLPGGGTLTVNQTSGAVTITTTSGTTHGVYTVRVTVQDLSGAAFVQSFILTIVSPNAVVIAGTASAPTTENIVPANGAVDPAETVTVNFGLTNSGGAATTNLVATLQSSGGVTRITTSENYGAIAPSATVQRAFQFTASGTCGGSVNATFQLQDGATNLGNITFVIRLGALQANTITLQNFDGVIAPALPAGWVATVAAGSTPAWATSTGSPHTAPNSAFATPTSFLSDNRLESPSIPIAGAAAQVTFRHRWNFEPGWDGGVLEIAIGSEPFTDILSAGGSMVDGHYNFFLFGPSDGSDNPLAGRPAWSGNGDGAYTTTTINLPASAAGHSIKLRWRLGCDSILSVAGAVWRIDSITLTDATYVCAGSAPTFSSVVPPGAPQNTAYTHTFTVNGSPPASFSVSAGTLPPGLVLNGAVLSGTPTTPGTYNGTITANNGILPNATQAFSIGITVVNVAPTLTSVATLAAAEDTPLNLTHATLAAAADEADSNGDAISFRVESVNSGTLTKNGVAVTAGVTLLGAAETWVWTPAPQGNGASVNAFTVKAWDGALASGSPIQVQANVTAVNDAPSFVKGAAQTVLEDAGAQTVVGWATAISKGPADESGQSVDFIVSNNNTSLFASQPAIGANGTLAYTPATNANGSATVTVRIHDNGGTANGGLDTSVAQTFTLGVTSVDDAPTITDIANQAINENTTTGALAFAVGDVETATASLTVSGFSSNTTVVPNANIVFSGSGANRTVTVTPGANQFGTVTITVVVSDGALTASDTFTLTITATQPHAIHAIVGDGYVAGGTVTITNTLAYIGAATSLSWHVLLPSGWSYASGGGSEGDLKPTPGTASVLDWQWTTPPTSPVTFSYTLNVPAGNNGAKQIAAFGTITQGPTPTQVLTNPDPLLVTEVPTTHSADTDENFSLSVFELTRVIELYNTRNGTQRTGAYAVAVSPTEDGFVPDPARPPATTAVLTAYHSADSDRDGRISIFELTRVIELYNYRNGTTRTGQYRVQSGTEDGFAPGP